MPFSSFKKSDFKEEELFKYYNKKIKSIALEGRTGSQIVYSVFHSNIMHLKSP